MNIRVGTRGSALARYQTGTVVKMLEDAGATVEVVIIRTAGDQDQRAPFAQIGAPGLFVRALEEALLAQTIDLAVHSYKDLPSQSPEGLTVAAVPLREDPSDALLTVDPEVSSGEGLLGLRPGARVGTASARRQAWLGRMDPSLAVEHLRGNLPRRIQRLKQGDFDAILSRAPA